MKFLYFAVLIVCKCLALDKPKADIRVNVAAQPNQMVRAAGAGAASSAITFPRSGPQHINPIKRLGEVCTSDQECKQAFAACTNGTCQCRAGFEAAAKLCQPMKRSCPYGDPLRDGDSVKQCERIQGFQQPMTTPTGPLGALRRKRQSAGAPMAANAAMPPAHQPLQINDTCPENFYCLVYGMQSSNEPGHCCPKPKSACPLGDADPNARCRFQAGDAARPQCNFHTHYCYQPTTTGEPTCCPKPCPVNTIFKNGQCYSRNRIGDACEVNEQCTNGQGVICMNGTCKCAKGWLSRQGSCMQPRCGMQLTMSMMTVEAQTPITDKDGEIKECSSSGDCGSGYCVQGLKFCCPKPAPYCPEGTDVKPQLCNARNATSCGSNQYCFRFLHEESNADSTSGTICCPKAAPKPASRPIG